MAQELTKSDLIDQIHVVQGGTITKEVVKVVLDSFVDVVNANMVQGTTVVLPGLGKIEAVQTAQRSGINPATGENITIAASYRVKFKPASRLKESVKTTS